MLSRLQVFAMLVFEHDRCRSVSHCCSSVVLLIIVLHLVAVNIKIDIDFCTAGVNIGGQETKRGMMMCFISKQIDEHLLRAEADEARNQRLSDLIGEIVDGCEPFGICWLDVIDEMASGDFKGAIESAMTQPVFSRQFIEAAKRLLEKKV